MKEWNRRNGIEGRGLKKGKEERIERRDRRKGVERRIARRVLKEGDWKKGLKDKYGVHRCTE